MTLNTINLEYFKQAAKKLNMKQIEQLSDTYCLDANHQLYTDCCIYQMLHKIKKEYNN